MEPNPEPPRDDDPYRSVWNMTPVGGTGGRRSSELRYLPGLIAGAVVLMPFMILAIWLWSADAVTGGWVITLLGVAGAFSMGAFVASDRS